jgi:TRAP transporter TAXI family solute receptor
MLGLRRVRLLKWLAAVLSTVGLSWLALDYFVPAPPAEFTIATGSPNQTYEAIGKRYREILARSHVKVEVLNTPGAVENLKLLNDPKSGVQVGIVQGGVGNSDKSPNLLSLGRVTYQFFWIFYRGTETLEDVRQLKGKRIALGLEGSGGRVLAEDILRIGGVNSNNTTLLGQTVPEATNALSSGKIDAMFLTIAADSPLLHSLLDNPDLRLMSLARAEALPRIYPYLVRLVVPQGLFDYERNIPAADVTIIATTLNVMVRKDFHPALIDLLAEAMVETHSRPGIFQLAGEFPTLTDPEYPVAQIARDFYKNGPSFLNRYLPFWMTNYAQRTIAVMVTVLAIVLPLFHYLPLLYRWNMRRRLLYWYGQLKALEASMIANPSEKNLTAKKIEIERIEDAVSRIRFPLAFADQLYDLRDHIDIVRRRLIPRPNAPIQVTTE